jgi:hypothetical protein
LRTFAVGSPERREFFQALVARGFLSEAEARAEGQSSKISKLCAIGENADFFRREEILSRLSPGYSNLYEAVQLLREIRKRSAQAEEAMATLLEGANGDVNREFLVNARQALKREATDSQRRTNPDSDEPEIRADAPSLAELLLLTPRRPDLRPFNDDYANPDALAAFRLNQMVTSNAVAVSIVEARDLAVVIDRVLPLAGFKYIRKVHLLSKPTSSDITGAKLAVVAVRTKNALTHALEPWGSDIPDERALAMQVAPDAVAKLQAFATDSAPGWTCLPGTDVWSEMPSLKGAA